MSKSSTRCKYQYTEAAGENCPHPAYKDHGFCIFHSSRIEEKTEDFQKALTAWLKICAEHNQTYDFRGFIFPAVDLRGMQFTKPVDISNAHFYGSAIFADCKFERGLSIVGGIFNSTIHLRNAVIKENVELRSCRFGGNAFFREWNPKGDVDLRDSHFNGLADFKSSKFEGNADLRKCQFNGVGDFERCTFTGNAELSECRFNDIAEFSESVFHGVADFRGGQFGGNTTFYRCTFHVLASFWMSQFTDNASFMESSFSGNVIFWMGKFSGIADFRKAIFQQRAEFKGATFHNELLLNESYVSFLKELQATSVNLEGVILKAAHMWGINRLEGYSFRDAFLLSMSLSEKELVNCDFTGTVFDAVLTRGWNIDDATIRNTKFIYTDYEKSVATDEHGFIRQVYKPLEESRVPAEGQFGEGENEGFTVAEYFKESFKWSNVLFLPASLRTSILNYLNFFRDFLKATKNLTVNVGFHPEGAKIRVSFYIDDEALIGQCKTDLAGYIENIFLSGEAVLHPTLGDEEKRLFLSRFIRLSDGIRADVSEAYSKLEAGEKSELINSIARFLSSSGTKEKRYVDSVTKSFEILVRRWDVEQTTKEKWNAAALAEAPVKGTPAAPPKASTKNPLKTAADSILNPTQIDTIVDIGFALDDLEDEIEKVRQDNPSLINKLEGIQLELKKIRHGSDDPAKRIENRTRMGKTAERIRLLLSLYDNSNIVTLPNKKFILSLCDRITEAI